MSELMKNPRDIVLVGIGFLLGIIFCYFLTAALLIEPKRGDMTVVFSPAPQPTNSLGAREANPFPRKAEGVRTEDPTVTFEPRSRYVPVRRINNLFPLNAPGGSVWPTVLQYDLIDFNYVPDFQLPAN
jgi:hypothetical protein